MHASRNVRFGIDTGGDGEDEARTKLFYRTERDMRILETVQMADEEKQQKDQLDSAEVQAEEDKVDLTVRLCMINTKQLLKEKEGKAKVAELIDIELDTEQKRLDKEALAWTELAKSRNAV